MYSFSKNKGVEFPQRVFEIGACVLPDSTSPTGVRQTMNICIASTHSNVNFTEIKSVLVFVCNYMGLECVVQKKAFPFLNENSVEIVINGKKGFIGELKKEVVDNFGLRKPVALLEFEL
ncbi:MAG: hypothetical protein PHP82_01815 [Candidatus ainarchaeum sp.]|nr:hypothetical protein [Candidatus ainarchaeum sp.]